VRARDLAALAVLCALFACQTKGLHLAPIAEDDETLARRTYRDACARCHGTDGRGHGRDVAAQPEPAPDLTTLAARHDGVYPRDYVVDVITCDCLLPAHGTRELPVWRDSFGPPSGPTAVAAAFAQRRLQVLADYIGKMQRLPAHR